jgi:hypothetical protein
VIVWLLLNLGGLLGMALSLVGMGLTRIGRAGLGVTSRWLNLMMRIDRWNRRGFGDGE